MLVSLLNFFEVMSNVQGDSDSVGFRRISETTRDRKNQIKLSNQKCDVICFDLRDDVHFCGIYGHL